MLKNYLLVAIRNFLRQGLFSFLNVSGLALGLASTLLIYLWLADELKMDKFHKDIDRVHHIVTNVYNSEGTLTWNVTPGPLAEEIKSNIPEVEFVAHIANDGQRLIQYDTNKFLPVGYFTDPEFFNIFSYEIVEGNTVNPLPNPSSIVLSKSLAEKLFGSEEAIGKIVMMRSENPLTVTAIMKDVTDQSSLTFEFIAHFDIHKKYRPQSWGNSDYITVLKFKETFDVHVTQSKINKHVARVLELNEEEQNKFQFYLQPFADRYLYGSFENGFPVSGRIKYVQIFSIVAIFILLVACINFMNMATARAAVRHKEIGVRKVIGAQRGILTVQFLGESVFVSALSMVLALVVVELALPLFNVLVSKNMNVTYTHPQIILTIVSIILLTGLLAGIYPAFILSRVNAVRALKGSPMLATQGASLRKTLVVFQFTISVVLIVSSIIVYKQINFIQSKNLGFDKENVILFSGQGIKDYDVFKDQLKKVPGVSHVSTATESLVEVKNQNDSFSWPGKDENAELYVRTLTVGFDFIETMNFTMAEGRSFSQELNDTANVIINKKLASLMGVENPIGLEINQWGITGKIIGIVEDFHSRSLSESMDPMVIFCYPKYTGRFYLRIEPEKTQEVLTSVGDLWKITNSLYPFEYTFLDSHYDQLYKQEQVIGKLATLFTLLAILISGLGLSGLAAYATERKKKEISVRKVLGATVTNLIAMISKEFIMLTLIALAIGCPLAYYFMNQFLQGYAYHVSIDYSVFIITGFGLLMITLLVILFQVTKAAIANPTDNLRSE